MEFALLMTSPLPRVQKTQELDLVVIFNALNRFRPKLCSLVEIAFPVFLQAKADPEDLLHEAFLRVMESNTPFPGETYRDFWNWLRSILQHNQSDLFKWYQAGKRQVSREQRLPMSCV